MSIPVGGAWSRDDAARAAQEVGAGRRAHHDAAADGIRHHWPAGSNRAAVDAELRRRAQVMAGQRPREDGVWARRGRALRHIVAEAVLALARRIHTREDRERSVLTPAAGIRRPGPRCGYAATSDIDRPAVGHDPDIDSRVLPRRRGRRASAFAEQQRRHQPPNHRAETWLAHAFNESRVSLDRSVRASGAP